MTLRKKSKALIHIFSDGLIMFGFFEYDNSWIFSPEKIVEIALKRKNALKEL